MAGDGPRIGCPEIWSTLYVCTSTPYSVRSSWTVNWELGESSASPVDGGRSKRSSEETRTICFVSQRRFRSFGGWAVSCRDWPPRAESLGRCGGRCKPTGASSPGQGVLALAKCRIRTLPA